MKTFKKLIIFVTAAAMTAAYVGVTGCKKDFKPNIADVLEEAAIQKIAATETEVSVEETVNREGTFGGLTNYTYVQSDKNTTNVNAKFNITEVDADVVMNSSAEHKITYDGGGYENVNNKLSGTYYGFIRKNHYFSAKSAISSVADSLSYEGENFADGLGDLQPLISSVNNRLSSVNYIILALANATESITVKDSYATVDLNKLIYTEITYAQNLLKDLASNGGDILENEHLEKITQPFSGYASSEDLKALFRLVPSDYIGEFGCVFDIIVSGFEGKASVKLPAETFDGNFAKLSENFDTFVKDITADEYVLSSSESFEGGGSIMSHTEESSTVTKLKNLQTAYPLSGNKPTGVEFSAVLEQTRTAKINKKNNVSGSVTTEDYVQTSIKNISVNTEFCNTALELAAIGDNTAEYTELTYDGEHSINIDGTNNFGGVDIETQFGGKTGDVYVKDGVLEMEVDGKFDKENCKVHFEELDHGEVFTYDYYLDFAMTDGGRELEIYVYEFAEHREQKTNLLAVISYKSGVPYRGGYLFSNIYDFEEYNAMEYLSTADVTIANGKLSELNFIAKPEYSCETLFEVSSGKTTLTITDGKDVKKYVWYATFYNDYSSHSVLLSKTAKDAADGNINEGEASFPLQIKEIDHTEKVNDIIAEK